MSRLRRMPGAPIKPALRVTCLMLVAVVVLHGPAVARQVAIPGQRRSPTAQRSRPADPAAQRTRELLRSIEWEEGPETVGLGGIAEIKVSSGFRFTGAKGSRAFLEVCRCPEPKELLGILAPSESFDCFIVFESRPAALKDGGPGKLDADALLRQLRDENDADNAVRRARGWGEFKNLEWERPPSLNEHRRALTWATNVDASGRRVVSSVTRLYGGSGVIDAHVFAKAGTLTQVEPTVENVLSLVAFAGDPKYGAGREAQAVKAPSTSKPSTSGGAPLLYKSSARGGGGSYVRTPGMITGFITAVSGAIGAAFRKKKGTA